MDRCGRKLTCFLSTIPICIGWILLYLSRNKTDIYLCKIVSGVSFSATFTMGMVILAEYTSPNMRTVFLNMTIVANNIGILLAHGLGFIFHWRITALLGIIFPGLAALLIILWTDSPVWLASKGRYRECTEVFQALRGRSKSCKKELQLLIQVEKKKYEIKIKKKETLWQQIFTSLNAFRHIYFLKLLLLMAFACLFRSACGKIIFIFFIIGILKDINENMNVEVCTIMIDLIFIIGTVIACILIRLCRMRKLLFSCGLLANAVLICICLCLYIHPFGSAKIYISWINISLLCFYFILICAGTFPVLDSLQGEIFPTEFKNIGSLISGILYTSTITSCVQFSVSMFPLIGFHGTFFIFSIVMLSCLLYFYKYLPETKGKTLQEIEIHIKDENLNDYIVDQEEIEDLKSDKI